MFFFFFKQKTAYEMRISDWSSDVCSSDLPAVRKILSMGEEMNRASQRALIDRNALARDFTRADLSPYFRPNATHLPAAADYASHAAAGFGHWRVMDYGRLGRALVLPLIPLPAL